MGPDAPARAMVTPATAASVIATCMHSMWSLGSGMGVWGCLTCLLACLLALLACLLACWMHWCSLGCVACRSHLERYAVITCRMIIVISVLPCILLHVPWLLVDSHTEAVT